MDILAAQVVKSLAGRDRGKLFIVLKTEENFAYLADGKLRKTENPKRKKIKHLQHFRTCEGPVFQKIINDERVLDSEIRKALYEIYHEESAKQA